MDDYARCLAVCLHTPMPADLKNHVYSSSHRLHRQTCYKTRCAIVQPPTLLPVPINGMVRQGS